MWRESLDDAKPEDSDDSHEVFRPVCGHHGIGGFSAPLGTQLASVQGDRVRMEGAPRESTLEIVKISTQPLSPAERKWRSQYDVAAGTQAAHSDGFLAKIV